MRIKKIFITTTFDCNLRCKYCFEHNKTNLYIDVNKMQAILQKEFCDSVSYDLFSITFHGGEPFLAFEEIKKMVIIYNFTQLFVFV